MTNPKLETIPFDTIAKAVKNCTDIKVDKWKQYHNTKQLLIKAIDIHFDSIELVNVYNNGSNKNIPLNTSGDHSLMNEHLGTIEMHNLNDKLKSE
jgi:hypothetical protein